MLAGSVASTSEFPPMKPKLAVRTSWSAAISALFVFSRYSHSNCISIHSLYFK